MPPWQEAYMYEGARFDDDALNRIVDYLQEAQDPALAPEDPALYQTPNIGEALETEEPADTGSQESGDEPTDEPTETGTEV